MTPNGHGFDNAYAGRGRMQASVRKAAGELAERAVEAMDPRLAGEEHKGALAGHDGDTLRLAEADGCRARV